MPSKIVKRGISRYRASITVKGITRQRMFPDVSKKTYREAVEWESKTKEEMEKELSRTDLAYLVMGDWVNDYLKEAKNRFSSDTFKEKKTAFSRFFKDAEIGIDTPINTLNLTVCRNFLNKQSEERSGYAANKDRKNLATAWKWGTVKLEGWPKGENYFLSVDKFPEVRQPRYVPPEDDFWKVYNQVEGQDQLMLLTFLH